MPLKPTPIINCLLLIPWILIMGRAGLRADTETSALRYAQHQYLKSANPDLFELVGWSIAISGDTAVIGAPGSEGTVDTVGCGAALVYLRDGLTWTQQAVLQASNGESADSFGVAVAISGDTIVVGAYFEDGNGIDEGDNSASKAGAAYVFVREGTTWRQQAYLKASNAQWGDHFGGSVCLAGDTLAVGASNEDSNGRDGESDNSSDDAGAVYVFSREGEIWTQDAYLKNDLSHAYDYFGNSLAISGNTMVIGARGDNSNGDPSNNSLGQAGAAYVFAREGSTWIQQAYLKSSDITSKDFFGGRVDISGDTILIGAEGASDSGAAYVFQRDGATWIEEAKLGASNGDSGDAFGNAVAIDGDIAVVGTSTEASSGSRADDNSASRAGAAYVFVRNGSNWQQCAYLKASNAEASDRFGLAVEVSGSTVMVGAVEEDGGGRGIEMAGDNSANGAGAAYVFAPPVDFVEPITSIRREPDGLCLELPRAPGRRVGVAYSPDLSRNSWIELGNFFARDGHLEFVDPDRVRTGRLGGFYRAFLRPIVP